MNGLFGPQINPYISNRLAGMRIQTSLYGKAIPIVYGAQRLAANLIWYGNFQAQNAQQAAGGKGIIGGAGKGNQNYIYYAAIAAMLCEGPIVGIGNVWDTQGLLIAQTQTETFTVPGGGGSHTTTPPNGGNHYADIGVGRADAYSGTANDYGNPNGSVGYSGTYQTPMEAVSSGPGAGQYVVTTNAGPPVTATYTFSAADGGKVATITYVYVIPENVGGGKGSPPDKLQLTLFTGTRPQTPWGFLTSKYPGQDLGYTGIAYVANSDLYLGSSGELPGLSFEILGFLPFGAGIVDANPALIIEDILTNTFYGLGLSSSLLDISNTIANYSAYCIANGLLLSVLLDNQETAASVIDRLMQITNSQIVWSGNILKIVTYGDTTAAGNGVIFTPNTTPIYDLDDDDYIAGPNEDPVKINIGAVADAYNDVRVEYFDRGNAYNSEVVEEKDDATISLYGLRPADSLAFHEICSQAIAAKVANLQLQRQVNIRNTYEFTLGWTYAALEPMDMVTLTDSYLGLNKTPARIISVEEDSQGKLKFTAEEFPWGTATPSLYAKQGSTNNPPNSAGAPGDINPPIIFEANNRTTGQTGQELWFGVSGQDDILWGGCHVWLSADGVDFKQIGMIAAASRMGVLANTLSVGPDPDTYSLVAGKIVRTGGNLVTLTFPSSPGWTTSDWISFVDPTSSAVINAQIASIAGAIVTVSSTGTNGSNSTTTTVYHLASIDLSESQTTLGSGTQADADNDRTLCVLDNELISYETAFLAEPNLYYLTYLRRAQMTSANAAHTAGAPFLRIDDATFKWQYDPTMIGQTLYFKFTSFNPSQQQEQGLADATAYTITIQGNYLGLLTPAHATYRPLSNPLTAHDAGSSVTINVAAFTMRIAGQDVANNSGSITGLLYQTLYYVYYDDPNFFGGAVTYHATLIKETAIAVAGRLFVGSILTPASGAVDTTGNNDGGSGSQIGGTFTVYFGVSSTQLVGNGAIANAGNANDGSFTDFAALTATANGALNQAILKLSNVPGINNGRYSSITFNALVKIPTNSVLGSPGGIVASVQILGAGIAATAVTLLLQTQAMGTLGLQILSGQLSTNINFGGVGVEADVSVGTSSLQTSGSIEMDVYECWLEFTE